MKTPIVHAPNSGTYQLESALLIYLNPHGGRYVSVHSIDDGKLGAGRPASRIALRDLARNIITETALEGWIAPGTLYVGADLIVWHRPASIETLFFKTPETKGPLAGECSVRVPQPPLIFAATGRGWFVWAMAGQGSPTRDAALYNAPYFNVWNDGAICTGNVPLPKRLSPDTTAGFERAFFGSRFTHPNHNKLTATDTAALWADLHDGADAFPANELIPAGKTLGQVIDQLIKGAKHD